MKAGAGKRSNQEERRDREKANRSSAFRAASHTGDFEAQIAAVAPVARHNVIEIGANGDTILEDVFDLVGVQRAGHGVGADWGDYCDALNAAFALGVATGQLLTPACFQKDRAR